MTIERLNELFVVDFMAGKLYWRVALSNRVKVGDRAGSVKTNGYRRVGVDGKLLLEHRVIVSMIEGRMLDSDEVVDHENGASDDNRIENLRVGTQSENLRNGRVHRAGKPVGVTWRKQTRRWRAVIRVDGRVRHILLHPDQTVAAEAFTLVDRLVKSGVSFEDARRKAQTIARNQS